jgi:hypothetical protein
MKKLELKPKKRVVRMKQLTAAMLVRVRGSSQSATVSAIGEKRDYENEPTN